MISNFLSKEQENFKNKKWSGAVIFTFILKFLFSIVSMLFIVSKFQDNIKEFKNYVEENKKIEPIKDN